ncbi:MAG: phage tail protein [Chloroflexi bacterium]|nr:phage tail protein [Chloroflexota bacterium]
MVASVRVDPYRSFNFRVEISGTTTASFRECSGLSTDGDAVDYREGTDPNTMRKLPGLRKYANVVLKRGYTQNLELWGWYGNITNGIADRRTVSIILMNEEHEDVLRWELAFAWINKLEGASFNAAASEVAIETIEIVHEGLNLVLP